MVNVVDVQSDILEPISEEERRRNRLQVKSKYFWSLPSYLRKMPSNQVEKIDDNNRCVTRKP